MPGHRPAASADQVEPTFIQETLDGGHEDLRGLLVQPILVGQAGVGYARDRHLGDL